MCITSSVESAPFFVLSTSFCWLSSWYLYLYQYAAGPILVLTQRVRERERESARMEPCYEQDWMFAKRSLNASVDGASTISSSRWFQSMIVLTKNECIYGSLFDGGTRKHLVLLVTWESRMLLVTWSLKVLTRTALSAAVVLRQYSSGGIAGTDPSTTLNRKTRRRCFLLSCRVTSCVQQAFGRHSLVIWTCSPQWWIWHLVAVL